MVEEVPAIHVRIDPFAEVFQLVVEHLAVRAGAHFQENGLAAEIVERLPAVLHTLQRQKHFIRTEDRPARVLEDSPNRVVLLFQRQPVSERKVVPACETRRHEDIRRREHGVRVARHEAEAREHLEEVPVHAAAVQHIVHAVSGRAEAQRGHGLDLRDLRHHIREAVGQARAVRQPRDIDPLPVRVLQGHGVLLPHEAADQDHKRQAHHQPNKLDGGV